MALDKFQQAAADFRKGNAAVSAAAGSGKTTVLVARAKALLDEGVATDAIKMLSFNTSAAAVGARRLNRALTGTDVNGPGKDISKTFHSFSLSLMKVAWEGRGLDAANFPKTLGSEEGGARDDDGGGGTYDPMRDIARQEQAPPVNAWTYYGACNNEVQKTVRDERGRERVITGYEKVYDVPDLKELVSLEPQLREALFEYGWPDPSVTKDVRRVTEALATVRGHPGNFDTNDEEIRKTLALAHLMVCFEAKKQAARVIDFSDMIIRAGDLIRKSDQYVLRSLARIKHLQVDEAQDSNYLRWYITRAVAKTAVSVLTVGDLRQSIQGFAGAKPELFKQWWDDCDASNRFNMPINYRSARAIIESGNAVAAGEPWNLTGNSTQGATVFGNGNVYVEELTHEQVAKIVKDALAANPNERKRDLVTVLSRTREALAGPLQAIRNEGIRARIAKGGSIWKSGIAAELLAYLWLARGQIPRDDARLFSNKIRDVIMKRPKRYISFATAQQIVSPNGLNLQYIKQMADTYARNPSRYTYARGDDAQVSNVNRLYEDIMHLRNATTFAERVDRVAEFLMDALKEDYESDRERFENPTPESGVVGTLMTLVEAAKKAADITDLMNRIRQETADDFAKDPNGEIIELDTIHGSKGGQWGTVIVVNVSEGAFPSNRAESPEDFAEEVRLLYVAVTRPITTLYVSPGKIVRFASKIAGIKAAAAKWNTKKAQGAVTSIGPDPLLASQGSTVTTAVTVPGLPTLASIMGQVAPLGEKATALTPPAVKGAAKSVTVTFEEFTELLSPIGFVEDFGRGAQTGQRVLALPTAEGFTVFVYTSVPPGANESRGVGGDSIKVALVRGAAGVGSFPIIQRTRNWRSAVVQRLAEAVATAMAKAASAQ